MRFYQISTRQVQIWGPYNFESPFKSPEEERALSGARCFSALHFLNSLEREATKGSATNTIAFAPNSLYPKQVDPGRREAARRRFLLWVSL